MDWSRVKTILIVALLATNLIIVTFIAFDDVAENQMSIEEQRVLIDKILSNAEVDNQIGGDVPSTEMMPQLTITYQIYDMPQLARRVLGDYSKENDFYQGAKYNMTTNDNTLYIMNLNDYKATMTDVKQAEVVATDFIKRYFGETTDFELLESKLTPNGVILKFGQKYEDYYIYGTTMRVVVQGDQIITFERKWMTVQVANKEQQPVKACCRALFSAIEKFTEKAPTTIEAVDLGYRLEKTLLGENVQSGDALPYYRFKLADDQQLFVPALAENF